MIKENSIKIGTLLKNKNNENLYGVVVPNQDLKTENIISVLMLTLQGEFLSTINADIPTILSSWSVTIPEACPGKVVIMVDMEGITNVPNDEEAVTPAEVTNGIRTPAYSLACKNMTLDVLYAIAGVRAAGSNEIIIADTHWNDTNLSDTDFDVPVLRGSQSALKAIEGASIAMMLGWHAKAGTPNACLPHTYTDRIEKLWIDDVEVGEIGMLQQLIASYGVPVGVMTGDLAASFEINTFSTNENFQQTPSFVVTKQVNIDGTVKHRNTAYVLRQILSQVYRATLETARFGTQVLRVNLNKPGVFKIRLRSGFEIDSTDTATRDKNGVYQIDLGNIRKNYSAFQDFVDQLPPNT